MRVVYWLSEKQMVVHKGVYLDGVKDLLSIESCNRDAGPRKGRRVIDTGERHAELPVGLLQNGWTTCARCFPVPRHRPSLADPLADPETAIMDAAAHESA